MSGEVPWSIHGTEGETGNDTTEITETNMHGDTDSSFGSSTDVVTIPGNSHGNIGVDPRDDEEGAYILNMGIVSRNKENEAYNGDNAEENHVGTALL